MKYTVPPLKETDDLHNVSVFCFYTFCMIKALKHLDGFYVVPWSLRLETFKKTLLNCIIFWSKKWSADKSVSIQEVAHKLPSTFSSFLSKVEKNSKLLLSFEIISILIHVFMCTSLNHFTRCCNKILLLNIIYPGFLFCTRCLCSDFCKVWNGFMESALIWITQDFLCFPLG